MRLSGDIDFAVAPTLTAALTAALEGGWEIIAVDCEDRRFIDHHAARSSPAESPSVQG
jgi:anti-anti-sigma regulatory factor